MEKITESIMQQKIAEMLEMMRAKGAIIIIQLEDEMYLTSVADPASRKHSMLTMDVHNAIASVLRDLFPGQNFN